MKIGNIEFTSRPVFLAPMEDVSDPPFRSICRRYGADLVYSEFISCGGLVHEAEESHKKLEFSEAERPIAIQIFGGNEEQVRGAVRVVNDVRPDLIDINFGCPVRKVVCDDGGAGILRNLPKMRAMAEAVFQEADCPVTVKTRLGWCEESIQILEVARILEGVGIKALTVHARTRSQMYKGCADWDWLRRIKDESGISIPLIGNGDATTPERVREMFEQTGVDAVMVGRGAIGNPWIFREAKQLLETGHVPPGPSWEERITVVAEHLKLKCQWLGERKGVLEMRKMYAGYFKGHSQASRLRQLLMEQSEERAVLETLLNFRPSDAAARVTVSSVP